MPQLIELSAWQDSKSILNRLFDDAVWARPPKTVGPPGAFSYGLCLVRFQNVLPPAHAIHPGRFDIVPEAINSTRRTSETVRSRLVTLLSPDTTAVASRFRPRSRHNACVEGKISCEQRKRLWALPNSRTWLKRCKKDADKDLSVRVFEGSVGNDFKLWSWQPMIPEAYYPLSASCHPLPLGRQITANYEKRVKKCHPEIG
jgi:hypothetical protein